MATQQTPATVEAKDKKTVRRERRRWTTALEDGGGNQLQFRFEKLRAGGFRTSALHVTGSGKKRTRTRGATAEHADEAKARAALASLVETAEKAGWTRRASRAFARKADAFDVKSLPAPVKPSRK